MGLLVYSDNSQQVKSVRNAVRIRLQRGRLHVTIQMGDQDYKSSKKKEFGMRDLFSSSISPSSDYFIRDK